MLSADGKSLLASKELNCVWPFVHVPVCMQHIYDTIELVQWVACLTADTCLTADPGVVSSIPTRSHTLVEIDH